MLAIIEIFIELIFPIVIEIFFEVIICGTFSLVG